MKVWPGRPYPLGATWDGEGVNFALFSENATSVELCLFDGPDACLLYTSGFHAGPWGRAGHRCPLEIASRAELHV